MFITVLLVFYREIDLNYFSDRTDRNLLYLYKNINALYRFQVQPVKYITPYALASPLTFNVYPWSVRCQCDLIQK